MVAPQTFTRHPNPELPEDQHTKLVVDEKIQQTAEGKWWFRKLENWGPATPLVGFGFRRGGGYAGGSGVWYQFFAAERRGTDTRVEAGFIWDVPGVPAVVTAVCFLLILFFRLC